MTENGLMESSQTEKLFYNNSHQKSFEANGLSPVRKRKTIMKSYWIRPLSSRKGAVSMQIPGIWGMQRYWMCRSRMDRSSTELNRELPVGEKVTGQLDWELRFMKMQQHTGEHIVSGIVHERYGYENVGFHLGNEDCTMDFNGEIPVEDLQEIEFRANQAVWENLKIQILYPSKEEEKEMTYRSKIEITGQVRVVIIPGYDACACCAPHVDFTGEIGLIKLVGMQRYKGGVRVTMLCGGRAMADYALKQKQAKEISAMLCAKENELTDAVAHLQRELAEKKTELAEKEQELIRCKAEQIPESEQIVCIFPEGIQGDSLRILMNAVLEKKRKLCAVFSGNDAAGYRYVIGSRDVDVRNMAKELNAAFEGRGGGRPEMVQGTVRGTEEELQNWILRKAEEL